MSDFLKRQVSSIFVLGTSLFLSHQCFAQPCLPQQCAPESGYRISIYGGGASVKADHSNLVLSPTETDALIGGRGSDTEFQYGPGLAYNFVFAPENPNERYIFHSMSIGVDVFHWENGRNGPVFLFENPLRYDYRYHINLNSTSYLLNTELNFRPFWGMLPFIEVGAGMAHNKMRVRGLPQPGFAGGNVSINEKAQNHFAYDLGGGLKVALTDQFELSLRYLYSHLGSAKTSKQATISFPGQAIPLVLVQPISASLRTQSILLGISYLIT